MSIIVKLLTAASLATVLSIIFAGLYMFACNIIINYNNYNNGKENYWVFSHSFILLIASWILIFGVFLANHKEFEEIKPNQQKGVVVHCKTCSATGETEHDVNLLMSEASFAIWYNTHLSSNKCEICSKDKLCDVAQQKYDEIMKKYKELGPKIEKATCLDCMGAGTYTQYDGYRFGREKL